MTDEADRQSAPIPPKVDLRKSGILRDKPPAKSETSRIPLEAAKPVARPAVPGLTIKPPAAPVAATPKPVIPAAARPVAPTARPAAPAAAVPVAPKPGTPAAAAPSVASAAKRKTSRISLEAALSAEDKPAAEGTAPKTIRLKRAGDPSAVKQADTAALPRTVSAEP